MGTGGAGCPMSPSAHGQHKCAQQMQVGLQMLLQASSMCLSLVQVVSSRENHV